MAQCFAHTAGPERHDGDAAANAAKVISRLYGRSERVLLGKLLCKRQHVIFSRLDAGPMERPHLVGSRLRVAECGIQTSGHNGNRIDWQIVAPCVLKGGGDEDDGRKIVIDFDRQVLNEPGACALACDFDVLPTRSEFPTYR